MHCDDFTRTDAERRSRLQAPISRRRAAAGRPRRDALAVRRARDAARARVRGRGGRAPPARPTRRCSSTSSSPAAWTCSTRWCPTSAYGRYADLRPALKVAQPLDAGGTGFGVHPSLGEGLNGGLKGLFDRGRLGFMPGIDYANPDLSHFNSPPLLGDRPGHRSRRRRDGSARWLDRHGGARQPVPGRCRWTRACRRCCAAAATPVAAVAVARRRPVVDPRRLGRVAGPQDGALRGHRRAAPARRRAPAAVFAAARQSQLVARALKPYVKDRRPGPIRSRRRSPIPAARHGEGTNGFAENLRYLAALLALPLGIRVATVDAPRRLRHPRRPGADARARPRAALAGPERLPGRPRGARHRRPRADARVDGVRPPPAGELVGRHRPRRRRHRLGHGRARARRAAVSPIPTSTPSTATTTSGSPIDFRAVYASLLEQWLGTDADEVLPDAGARRARGARGMTALIAAAVLAAAGPATPVGLGMRECRISVYRSSVPPGRVRFNMTNFGEDAHNLRVSGPGGYRSAVSPTSRPSAGTCASRSTCCARAPTGWCA